MSTIPEMERSGSLTATFTQIAQELLQKLEGEQPASTAAVSAAPLPDVLESPSRPRSTEVPQSPLPPVSPPPYRWDGSARRAAQSFSDNLNTAMAPLVPTGSDGAGAAGSTAGGGSTDGGDGMLKYLNQMSSDQLLTAFLKLNLLDPNNSPENHDLLHKVLSDFRKAATREEIVRAEAAERRQQEALELAERVAALSKIMMIVGIVLSVALVAASFGAGSPVAVMMATMMVTMLQMAMEAMKAYMQYQVSQKQAEAASETNKGKMWSKKAEEEQEMIQEQAEIIKTLMEMRNRMVEQVIRMSVAAHLSAVKMMQAYR